MQAPLAVSSMLSIQIKLAARSRKHDAAAARGRVNDPGCRWSGGKSSATIPAIYLARLYMVGCMAYCLTHVGLGVVPALRERTPLSGSPTARGGMRPARIYVCIYVPNGAFF